MMLAHDKSEQWLAMAETVTEKDPQWKYKILQFTFDPYYAILSMLNKLDIDSIALFWKELLLWEAKIL